MPFYNYKCDTCGKTFEYKQKITEDALTHCPKELCESDHKGNGEVHRMISKNVGLIFNGSGFYQTDYVKKSTSLPVSETNAKTDTSPKTEATPAVKSTAEKAAS